MTKATKSAEKLPKLISAAGLARLFGISVQRIGQLADQGAVIRRDRNAYDLEGSIRAYTAHLRKAASGGGADAVLSNERTRLTRARADMAEAERQQQAGILVDARQVEDAWLVCCDRVRTRILAVPTIVGGRLGPQAAELVRGMLYEAMEEISKTSAVPGLPKPERRGRGRRNGKITKAEAAHPTG